MEAKIVIFKVGEPFNPITIVVDEDIDDEK